MSSKSGKSRRSKPATTPGAVSMMGEDEGITSSPMEPSAMAGSMRHLNSSDNTETSEGSKSPARRKKSTNHHSSGGNSKKKRSTRAINPGVVSVGADGVEEPPLMNESNKVSTGMKTTVVAAHGMSKPARVSTGEVVLPGAVSVATATEASSPTAAAVAPPERKRSAVMQAAHDEAVKSRARSSRMMGAATKPGVQAVTGEEAEEQDAVIRRKDPRAHARKNRKKAAAAAAGATAGAATAAAVSKPTGATQAETSDEYTRRMEAKVREMEKTYGDGPDTSDEMSKHKSKEFVTPSQEFSKEMFPDYTAPPPTSEKLSGSNHDPYGTDDDMKDKLIDIEQNGNSGPADESDAPITTADHGMVGAPGLQYGTVSAGYGGPGFGGMDDDALAVAVAIQEEEELFFPSAIEYDPDSKPPLHKNRRFRLYAMSGVLLLIVVIVGATVGVIAGTSRGPATFPPTVAPSAAPTTRETGEYIVQFTRFAGDEVNIAGTPAFEAANWIMNEDPLQLKPNAPNLIQRFILATFYFSTSRQKGWLSCGRPAEDEDSSCVFQEIVRARNDDQIYTPVSGAVRWLSGEHECAWNGNHCDDLEDVVSITVWGQNLTGTIPTVLSELSHLQQISLAYNHLSGSIPSGIGLKNYLLNIELHGNALTGTIPEDIFDLQQLLNLNIGQNQLTGTLSPEVGRLTDLKGLHVFRNQFNGTFPETISQLTNLAFFRVWQNQFTGPLHSGFGLLKELQELWFYDNLLTGTIPAELGDLSRLADLRIHKNRLEGSIPDELYSLTGLFRLDIYEMFGINGTISTEIGQLTDLEFLRFSRTSIEGTIPTELGECKKLLLAWLHVNNLNGTMPQQVCENRGIGTKLQVLQTDCDGNPPGVSCEDCCTSCCDRSDLNLCAIEQGVL